MNTVQSTNIILIYDCPRMCTLGNTSKVEVTSDPTTTGDKYDEAVSFLAPLVCKIIAQYHWGFKELWSVTVIKITICIPLHLNTCFRLIKSSSVNNSILPIIIHHPLSV